MTIKILITGASVAGNALAWWLGRTGNEVTVVERASAFRDGGQNVDVRGVGRAVMRSMGLDAEALARGTGEEGTAWVDGEGRVAACFMTNETSGDGPTAEMEILRGDLSRLIYEPARENATYRFDDYVTAIEQTSEVATVTFASGATERFDAVIIAEGVGSATRELVFPGENRPRWMNLAIAYFTIPRVPGDDRLWRWYHARGGRSVSLRPDRHGTTRAMLTVQKPPKGEHNWAVRQQKAWLRETFVDAGWQSQRVLAGMEDTADFYFDVLRQVRMPRWSNGRVALCGDAAWCVTPVGSVGTTLAVTGARVLAGEIGRAPDFAMAFAAYEQAMQPMVKQAQGIPSFAPRLANPHSRMGIRALHSVMAFASRPTMRAVASKLSGSNTTEPDLSRYEDPLPVAVLPSAAVSASAVVSPPAAPPPPATVPSPAGTSTGLSPVAALGVVALVLGASAVVGRRNAPDPSHPGIRRWYRRLDKPGYTPPDKAFGAVWPVLEGALAIGGYRLLRHRPTPARNAAVGLWLANTAMIGGWTELFFRKKQLGASAAASGAMVATGAALVATAAKTDKPAAALATPFVAWLGFATVLAERIRRDNRDGRRGRGR